MPSLFDQMVDSLRMRTAQEEDQPSIHVMATLLLQAGLDPMIVGASTPAKPLPDARIMMEIVRVVTERGCNFKSLTELIQELERCQLPEKKVMAALEAMRLGRQLSISEDEGARILPLHMPPSTT